MAGTMEAGAKTLWASLQRLAPYPDWLQLWPGHGAGSSCGKGISAVPHSTLGYERLFNWAFNAKSEAEFVENVLKGQPDPPPYFAVMKQREQGRPTGQWASTANRRRPTLDEVLAQGSLVIDTRPAADFADSHRHGALNIPLNGSFVTWAGWLIPYDRDFYVITDRIDDVKRALALIGLDRIAGDFSAFAGRGGEDVPQVSATSSRRSCRKRPGADRRPQRQRVERRTHPVGDSYPARTSRRTHRRGARPTRRSSCNARAADDHRSLRRCCRNWPEAGRESRRRLRGWIAR